MPKLTKRVVDEAAADPNRVTYLWDTEITGFGLRIGRGGKKVYVAQYRLGGRGAPQRRMKLGVHGTLTAEQARAMAKTELGKVSTGSDPGAARDQERAAAADTLETAFRHWIEQSAGKREESTAALYDDLFGRLILPDLGKVPVSRLTHAQVAAWHARQRRAPYQGNRALSALAALMAWCIQQGRRSEGAANPCRGITRFKEEARQTFLSEAELGRVLAAMHALENEGVLNPIAGNALRLLILTGARRSEIRTLQWEHVDLDRACLNLPKSKTGRKTIILPPDAVRILRGMPRIVGNPFVFPGQKRGAPFACLNRPWDAVRVRAGLKPVRLHDLRHTYASRGVALGVPLFMVGKQLGHSRISTTSRYAHFGDDQMRETAALIGGDLGRAMNVPEPTATQGAGGAEVVTISDARRRRRLAKAAT